MSLFSNVLRQEDIDYLNNLPEVLHAKARLSTTNVQYFKVALNETIKLALSDKLGLNLSSITHVPMRWIKGDTMPHVDTGASKFDNTYLVYLNVSEGNFILEDISYPIKENTGFVFSEGLEHKTEGTGSIPRLLLGPMNEFAQPVGAPPVIVRIAYYANYADAIAGSNNIETSNHIALSTGVNTILGNNVDDGSIGSYTKWKIAYNNGNPVPSTIFNNGDNFAEISTYPIPIFVYAYTPPTAICFLEGTKILCKDADIAVEDLKCGDLVKTLNGYKAIVEIKKNTIVNPGTNERTVNRLYSYDNKLFLTGAHSVLVDSLTQEQKEKTAKHLGLVFPEDVESIFVAESKCKLMAYIDDNAEPWNSEGLYTIWHIALENTNKNANYGIYANGYLVESCSINTLSNN